MDGGNSVWGEVVSGSTESTQGSTVGLAATSPKRPVDKCGKSHYLLIMNTATLKSTTARKGISILRDYDTAADAKNRVSLRGAKAKYFHVQELSNGSYVLEPRVLVSPDAIPARTLKMLNRSVVQLKKGNASAPIDLSPFI